MSTRFHTPPASTGDKFTAMLCADPQDHAVETLLLTPEEASCALSIGRTRIYELLKSGALKSVTIGRSRRIPASALHAYVDSLREKAGETK